MDNDIDKFKELTPIDILIEGEYLKDEGKSYSEVTSAIKNYQLDRNLPVTGRVNLDTLIEMKIPKYQLKSIPIESSWEKQTLTYKFDNFNVNAKTKLNQEKIKDLFKQAYEIWTRHIPIKLEEVTNSNADIHIGFYYGYHGGGDNFVGWKPLAYTFYPPLDGHSVGVYGDIHFNNAVTWTEEAVFNSEKVDFITIAAHEFGHCLGLKHSNLTNSLMYENIRSSRRTLTNGDILAIQDVYGHSFA